MVFLRREHRYAEACEIAGVIGRGFRAISSAARGQANLLRASGKNEEAEQQYRRVWQNGRDGKYGNLHYEIAALALGDLLRSQKKYEAAAAAYELVSEVSGADAGIPAESESGSRRNV
jgi:tetratricopeptide (TPR) repeat protein